VGDDTLRGELLDLIAPVLVPVLDVLVLAHSERAASVDEGGDGILETSAKDELLVELGGTSLNRSDETGSNPDSLSTPGEVGGESSAVIDSTGTDNVDGLAVELGELALADVDASRDENAGRDVSGVASSLTGLGADDVATGVDGLLDMLGVADHVHDGDAGLVKLVDGPLGGNTDGGNKELCLLRNDNLDELRKLALGVVVLDRRGV